ncbi:MAG: hypothetical protein JJU40_03025, partial [Rhodobacteraceae bacterium]|nr:hypothetical protein [Paracoccaceae bacterium]
MTGRRLGKAGMAGRTGMAGMAAGIAATPAASVAEPDAARRLADILADDAAREELIRRLLDEADALPPPAAAPLSE